MSSWSSEKDEPATRFGFCGEIEEAPVDFLTDFEAVVR